MTEAWTIRRAFQGGAIGVRHGFQAEDRTRRLMASALRGDCLLRVFSGWSRDAQDLAEEQVLPMLQMLADFGLLRAIHWALGIDWALLRGPLVLAGFTFALPWVCLFGGILFHQPLEAATEAAERLPPGGARKPAPLANWRFALWCLHWPNLRPVHL